VVDREAMAVGQDPRDLVRCHRARNGIDAGLVVRVKAIIVPRIA